MSSFFRDALARPIFFVDQGGSAGRGFMIEARDSTCLKYTTRILAIQWSWTLMSVRMNLFSTFCCSPKQERNSCLGSLYHSYIIHTKLFIDTNPSLLLKKYLFFYFYISNFCSFLVFINPNL
jgi:hypothetical protein